MSTRFYPQVCAHLSACSDQAQGPAHFTSNCWMWEQMSECLWNTKVNSWMGCSVRAQLAQLKPRVMETFYWTLSSVHWVQRNLWSGMFPLSSSNYMFLLCFYFCHFLFFPSLFLSIIVSSIVVHFLLNLTQTMVIPPNVLWSSGKFPVC